MTSITRQQLRDAIEAGITAAEPIGDFRERYAEALRKVASTTSEVARGTYAARTEGGGTVKCPVGQAFVDWRDVAEGWNLAFAQEYDRATMRATRMNGGDRSNVLQVTDNDSTESGAA